MKRNIYFCLFLVDRSEAGIADLESQVIAPSGQVIPLEVKPGHPGDVIEWYPDAPGQYRITVLYGGEEVNLQLLIRTSWVIEMIWRNRFTSN